MDAGAVDLESRLAFQEDDLRRLGDLVARQQRELQALRQDVSRLQELVRALAPSQVGDAAEEPPPPHY